MRILVVRLKQIGDALLSAPVCSSLRRHWPQARIDYVLYEHIAPLFEGHPDIDRVIAITPAERASSLRFVRRALSLRRERYDLAVDLHATFPSALLARLSGARRVVGFDHHRDRSWLYHVRVPHRFVGTTVARKLQILAGVDSTIAPVSALRLEVDETRRADIRQRLLAAGVDRHRPLVAFATASRRDYKVWPPEFYARVLDHCIARHDIQPLLLWGPGERAHVDNVASMATRSDGVLTDFRTADVRELAALLAVCDLFVGNDGGPRHIAEAVGTPTLAIFSPPVPVELWMPNPSSLHRAVDIRDALGIDDIEYRRRRPEFERECERYYRLITPELVMRRLDDMITALRAEGRLPPRGRPSAVVASAGGGHATAIPGA